MAFLGSFDISASGMSAQRVRMDIAAENIANMDTTRTESGGPSEGKMYFLKAIQIHHLPRQWRMQHGEKE